MSRRRTKAEEIRNPEHYFNRYIACERKKEQEEDTEYYNLHESLDSMILYAAGKLKRNTSETSAVSSKPSKIQPPTKTQQANTQSVSFSLEAQQLYQQLADQYTRIVNMCALIASWMLSISAVSSSAMRRSSRSSLTLL